MKRSRWILLAALIFCSAPAPAADKTVGVIMSGNLACYHDMHKAFVGVLLKEGFDFRKVDTLLQMPAPDPMSWTNASRKLTVADVKVLVTYGAPAALASIRETKSIPIVYAGVYDPASIGVLARNITGISSKVPITSLLKYLKKLVPFTRLAVVYNELEPDSVRQVEELQQHESMYGFTTVKMAVKRSEDAKKLVFEGKADAVFVSVSAVVNEAIDAVIKSAQSAKVPTASLNSGLAERGVILSLFPSSTEQGEAAGRMVVRILRGENPASILVEMPKLIELVLNIKEAGVLGLKVPVELISDATKVIK